MLTWISFINRQIISPINIDECKCDTDNEDECLGRHHFVTFVTLNLAIIRMSITEHNLFFAIYCYFKHNLNFRSNVEFCLN